MSSKANVLMELLRQEHTKRLENNDRDYSYFHPSEFHECIRKIAYKYYKVDYKQNIKPDLQRVFDNGTYTHLRFNEYFKNLGMLYGVWRCKNPLCSKKYGLESKFGIKYPTEKCSCGCDLFEYEELQVNNDEYMISGHIDCVTQISTDMVVIDFKTIHSNGFTKLTNPLNKHIIQINIYLWLLDFHCGLLLYENKDSQRIKIFEVARDNDLIEKIKKRATILKDIIKNKKIPKQPFKQDSDECGDCVFSTTCWKNVKPEEA